MNNLKISEMAEAESLNDNDLLTIVQSGINKKITKQNAIGDIIQAINNPTYTTTEGTDFSIDSTRVGKMKFEYYGDTEQESTNGYNLLPYQEFVTKTISGVTFTNNNDGTYTVNGTATADASVVVYDTFMAMSGTWRMLGCPTGGSASTYMLSAYVGYWGEGSPNIDTGNGTNITYTGNVKIRFYIKNGTTCNNLIFKPMLTTNTSLTINDFEKYTGGIASPNPDYQQEVKKVTGENTIDIVGKNFYNSKDTAKGTISQSDGKTISPSNDILYTQKYIAINTSEQWTLSYNGSTSIGIRVFYYDKNKNYLGTVVISSSSNKATFTKNASAYYLRMQFNQSYDNELQLEKGSTASTYEEFKGQSYEVNLGKNLFQVKPNNNIVTRASVTFLRNDDGTIVLNGTTDATAYVEMLYGFQSGTNTSSTIYIPLNNKKSYTLSVQTLGGTTTNAGEVKAVAQVDSTDTQVVASATTPIAITNSIGIYRCFLRIVSGVTFKNYKIGIQLEKGSLTKFAPYFEPIQLCDIEGHQDYIYNNGGKWFKHKEVGKKILNGTENWNTASQNYPVFNVSIFTDKVSGQENFKCNNFSYLGNAQTTLLGYAMSFNTDIYSQYMYIQVPSSVVSQGDVTAFKSWLSANTATVYYPLKVSEEEEITEPTLINQLNAIKYGAESYYGQTNIIITSEELQPTLKVQTLDKIGE